MPDHVRHPARAATPRSAADRTRAGPAGTPAPASAGGHPRLARLTQFVAMVRAGAQAQRAGGLPGGAVLQRRIAAEWMPNMQLPQMVENATPAEALEAYLYIPVGVNNEYFRDVARAADDLLEARGGGREYASELKEIENEREPDLAQLQDLAVRINAEFDRGDVARRAKADATEREKEILRAAEAALAVIPERLDKPGDAHRLLQWQAQLKRECDALRGGRGGKTTAADIQKFTALITALPLHNREIKRYDTSWKTTEMESDIVVDSEAGVVGATINFRDPLTHAKTRRRLTVSKARHMWDFADAVTNESNNSLLPRGVDIASVEADIRELARDFKTRFMSGKHAEAYDFQTSTGRIYHLNKTGNEYPHSYPVSGGDVVPLSQVQYNFLIGVKPLYDGLAKAEASQKRAVLALRDQLDMSESDVTEVLAVMRRLKLAAAADGFALALEEEARESSVSSKDRALAKGKKTQPRKGPDDPRKKWNE